jgi:hypothetical protein
MNRNKHIFASEQRFHPLLSTVICLQHEAAGFDSFYFFVTPQKAILLF